MVDPKTPARIGIFGGAFNPPHLGHVLVVAWALASGEVDEVWVVPSGGHPFGKPLAPWADRVEMCWRAFECFGERVSLLDVEQEPRVHYSIDTVRILQARVPGMQWRWLMGSDTLQDAPRWKAWDELMQLAPPLIIPRAGHASAGETGTGAFALPAISSTHIRDCLAHARREEVRPLLPGGVMALVEEQGLYRQSDEQLK